MSIAIFRSKSILLGAVLLLTTGGAALAQEAGETVTVDGAYIIHRETKTDRSALGNITEISISRQVHYADLDLDKDWGQYLLGSRIKDAARDVCGKIDREFPLGNGVSFGDDSDCVQSAVAEAVATAKVQIAASHANGGTTVALLP